MMYKMLIAIVFFLAAGLASAKDAPLVDAKDGVSFAEQRERVLEQLADGETYAEISLEDRNKVTTALDRMLATLDGGGSATTTLLSADKRLQLLNDQELVNNILTQAGEDSRMVCRREAPVGTRMARSQCLTVAERRRRREEAQRNLDTQSRGMEGVFTR